MGPPINLISTVCMIGASVYLWANNKSLRAAIEDQQIKQSFNNLTVCESKLHHLAYDVSSLHDSSEKCRADTIGNSKDIRTLAFISGMIRNKGRDIKRLEEQEIESERDEAKTALHDKSVHADGLRKQLKALQSELKTIREKAESTRSEIIKFKDDIKNLT